MLLEKKLLAEFRDRHGLECHPFKVQQYNEAVVDSRFRLPYPDETLAYVVLSTPDWFEKSFLPFLARNYANGGGDEDDVPMADPVDQCMRYEFARLVQRITERTGIAPVHTIHDFELEMPSRRPKILAQTAAHVSGAAYYYRPTPGPNGTKPPYRLGVCIHPDYGGWFGIRGVILLPTVMASPEFEPPKALDVIGDSAARQRLLTEFNERWQEQRYRDVIPVRQRYSPLQTEYFRLKPKDRWSFIRNTILPKILGTNHHHTNVCTEPKLNFPLDSIGYKF